MGRIDELVSAEFAAWEQRGRGWRVWPEPVRPEPAFEEFTGYRLAQSQFETDDARRPGLFASLFDSLEKRINPRPSVLPEETLEPEPTASGQPLVTEFVASLPASLNVPNETVGTFLDSLQACAEPTSFELFAHQEHVTLQFVSSASDAPVLQRQLTAYLPQLAFVHQMQNALDTAWNDNRGVGFIVEFGLAHEFMLPLQTRHSLDPLVGLAAALSEVQRDEVALFQVLFEPAQNSWAGSIWRSITDKNGEVLFGNLPNLIPGTKEKLEKPLFGVVMRAAAKSSNFERAATVVRGIASALRPFNRVERNSLIPLDNDEYPFAAHDADLTSRQSRRGGMFLNRDELIGFVHLPSDAVRASKLRRQLTPTKAAPSVVHSPSALLLGHNQHAGTMTPVYLSTDRRVEHMHIVGASGTGKSTLLFNLIRQDIENGEGVGVFDPHGDLVKRILGIIPPRRIDDVVLVDLSDEEFVVGFNILSAHNDFEKRLVASDLVSVFRRLSTSWGDQMESVLNNAILAFLESSRGGTLSDLRRFLLEPGFRKEFLTTVRDPEVLYYWRTGFAQLSGNKSIGPVLTRLGTFLSRKPIRYMVSQPVNRLDFAQMLDTGKIFLARLPQGEIGQENAFLLGSLLVSKFQQLAMSRQRMEEERRRDFWLYVDEFHHFITSSIAEILTGARKYRLGLILAHQELRQLQRDPEVASAVMATHTRVVFRVADADARTLESGFSNFQSRDLQNLGKGEAICRVERSDFDFNLTISPPSPPDAAKEAATRREVTAASRKKYATPRAEVEAAQAANLGQSEPDSPKTQRASPPVPKGSEPPPGSTPSEVPNRPNTPQEQTAVNPSVASKQTTEIPSLQGVASADKPEGLDNFHEHAKTQIAEAAAPLYYTVNREHWALERSIRVDLVLERGRRVIACEICATSTAEQEVAHVAQRLEAGFTDIAVVCKSHRRLAQIQQTVLAALPPDKADRVGYYHLAEFIAQLQEWARQDPAGGEAERSKPRKRSIRLGGANPSEEERRRQEKAGLDEIARAMKIPPQNPG